MASGVRDIGPVRGPGDPDGFSLMQLTADSGDIPRAELLAALPASASAGSSAVATTLTPTPAETAERRRELEVLAMAQAGDERALRYIYERHERQVRGHLHRLLGSDSEIDDLVQVVFSRAFAAIDRFEGKAAISTWLYRITINTTQNLMRQRFRRERMQRALRLFDIGRGADRIAAGKLEARDEARRILARLHPDLRQIFVLYHYQGLTLQEIADIVERPISTVGDRLTRARKQLRELVSED